MSNDGDPLAERPSSRPDCPNCGEPVSIVTSSRLYRGTVSPCGCSVNPGLLTTDPADRGLGTGE
ncbi:hypothetical protein [Natrinema salsiterrestre]|uniref:Small CPxCG-related zinc finger protein n=1 Tax=Natrinema salsiterrestre TaxID=2950540 RepID=A0A9Q4Q248_9EURY|nr:hypothetical protein [Natrinema salsiterrestre]MDF9744437.1 hypothetical protein [Natrinema salsiterrestre]